MWINGRIYTRRELSKLINHLDDSVKIFLYENPLYLKEIIAHLERQNDGF